MTDEPPATVDDSGVADDRLRLIFTCCHPALSVEAQVALTLAHARRPHHRRDRASVPRARADDGATPRAGEAQDPRRRHPVPRAARAPAARAHRRGPRRALPPVQRGIRREQRRPSWSAPISRPRRSGSPRTLDRAHARRARSAARCSRSMLLHDARRAGRIDADGGLVLLEDQDRTAWDQAHDRGRSGAARPRAAPAATRSVPGAGGDRRVPRDRGRRRDDTDWQEIALLYGELVRMTGSPVVELNRAVAVAMADGPDAGLVARRRAVGSHSTPTSYLHAAARRPAPPPRTRRGVRGCVLAAPSSSPPRRPSAATSSAVWPSAPPAEPAQSAAQPSADGPRGRRGRGRLRHRRRLGIGVVGASWSWWSVGGGRRSAPSWSPRLSALRAALAPPLLAAWVPCRRARVANSTQRAAGVGIESASGPSSLRAFFSEILGSRRELVAAPRR